MMTDSMPLSPLSPPSPLRPADTAGPARSAALRAPLWLLGSAFVAAVWLAYFPLPILTFYKEWLLAMLLAMVALAVPAGAGKPSPALRLGRWSPEAGAVAVLGAVLLLQGMGIDGVWPAAVLMIGYLAFFLFTHHLGRRLAALDLSSTLSALAAAVIVAGLGNAFFSAAQLHGWDTGPWPLVAPSTGSRLGGNLSQVNHAATMLWLAVVATLGAWQAGRLSRGVAIAVAALFGCFIIATGSRMPLLVAAILFLASFLVRRQAKDAGVRRMALGLMGLAAGLPALELVWNLVGVPELLGLTSGGRRLAHDGGSGEIRRWLLRAAWDAAVTHPLAGVGVGRYVHHTYELAISTGRTVAHAAELHAHNLVVHTAAELGFPAAAALLAALLAVLRRCWRLAKASTAGFLLAAAVVVILVHAMLEYPLSYAYFLGALGLMLGMLFQMACASTEAGSAGAAAARTDGDTPASLAPVVPRLRWEAVGVLLLCLIAHRLQAPVERAMQEIVFQVSMGAVPELQEDVATALDAVPAWSPYRDHALAARIIATVPSKENVGELTNQCERALMFGPTSFLLARCAVSFQLAGNPSRASALATSQCVMYPGTQYLTYQLFALIGSRYPEILSLFAPCLVVTRS